MVDCCKLEIMAQYHSFNECQTEKTTLKGIRPEMLQRKQYKGPIKFWSKNFFFFFFTIAIVRYQLPDNTVQCIGMLQWWKQILLAAVGKYETNPKQDPSYYSSRQDLQAMYCDPALLGQLPSTCVVAQLWWKKIFPGILSFIHIDKCLLYFVYKQNREDICQCEWNKQFR